MDGTRHDNVEERQQKSTIDVIYGSSTLTNRLVACELAEDVHADSNHFPLRAIGHPGRLHADGGAATPKELESSGCR
jgi:hypothetical protein